MPLREMLIGLLILLSGVAIVAGPILEAGEIYIHERDRASGLVVLACRAGSGFRVGDSSICMKLPDE